MISVIIPAGGQSVRFGGDTKKQFLKLNNDSILNHSISIFLYYPEVSEIVVCLPKDELNREDLIQHNLVQYVEGGKTRSESVYNGFCALKQQNDQNVVLVHDAARPFVSHDLVMRVVSDTQSCGAAIPALSVTDTIKSVDENDFVKETIDRRLLRAVQTPQGFLLQHLKKAYSELDFKDAIYTDESMLVEALGVKVRIVSGEKENIKVTNPFDLVFAKAILEARRVL